jgi:RecA-family ATPase
MSAENKPEKSRFLILDADSAAAACKPPSYIVNGILETDAHGTAFGGSGGFKTFWCMRLAHSIATGKPFMGRSIRQKGLVVIVCGEGSGGISRRAKALINRHGAFQENLKLIPSGVDISDAECMHDLQKLLESLRPVLVIFDTFASLNGGIDENSPSEVGQCLRLVKNTCRAAGASSIIVHHSGKDVGKGARGAGNFYNDMDFVFSFSATDPDHRKFEVTSNAPVGKSKDSEPFTIAAKAEIVLLGIFDEDGNESCSLVVEYDENPAQVAITGRRGND